MGNKIVAARTLKPKTLTLPETSDVRAQVSHDRTKPVQTYKTLPERVAKSSVYFKNFYPAELREKFSYFDRMKRIDFCFPFARLGNATETTMLLVDTPETEADVEVCYKKAPLLKAAGYKYCIVEKDSNLFEVLQQLGVIE